MTNRNDDRDFPADELDRWVQDQRPAEPSSAFLDHCLATIPAAETAESGTQPALAEQPFDRRRPNTKKRLQLLGISGAGRQRRFVPRRQPLAHPTRRGAEGGRRPGPGAAAVPNVSTVHIVAKTRRHFPHIFADADFVAAEVWKRFGDKPRWRVEQPGTLVVMDGVSTIGLFRRHPEDPEDIPLAEKIPHATTSAWDVYPLLNLARVGDMIALELRSALAEGWDLKLSHETTPAGEKKLVVAVEAKADVPAGDCRRDHFWDDCDMRRVYRFDAQTQRLDGFAAYLHQPGGDVLILTVERIEYNKPIDPALFVLQPPKNAYWITDPKPLPDNEKYAKMTPKQAAQAFFEACAKEDWAETQKFRDDPWSRGGKEYYGGLTIVHIGAPFQSARDAGKDIDWFVPYEVKLKNGRILKHNLALRKYESAKRYLIGGGI